MEKKEWSTANKRKLKRFYHCLKIISVQQVPVRKKVDKKEVNNSTKGVLIDTLLSNDIQAIEKIGGAVIENYE